MTKKNPIEKLCGVLPVAFTISNLSNRAKEWRSGIKTWNYSRFREEHIVSGF